jgi:hypothetical protein
MQFSFVGTEQDFIDVQRTHAWRKYSPRAARIQKILLPVSGLFLIVMGVIIYTWHQVGFAIFNIAVGLYLALWSPLIVPFLYKRSYRRRLSGGSNQVEVTILDSSLTWDCPGEAVSILEWPTVKGVVESPTTILFYLSPASFLVIPTRIITPDQHQELMSLLRSKGIPLSCPKPVRNGVAK